MASIDFKSIFTPEFIARMLISVIVGSATLWIVGDRLLTHALGGDRARVDTISVQMQSLSAQIEAVNESVHKHDVLVARLDTLLKILELNNKSKARQFVIDVLGRSSIDDEKIERVLEIFELYDDELIEEHQTDLPDDSGATGFERITHPQPTSISNKVEVLEYLWLGCPHCWALQSSLEAWEKTMPDYVHFVREAPPLNSSWENHSRGFYAAKLLNKENEFVSAMFNAIHVDKQLMRDKKLIAELASTLGIDKEVFLSMMDSSVVSDKLNRAVAMATSAEITAVPTIIVNGKYRLTTSISGGHDEMLKAIDERVVYEKAAMKLP